MPIEAISGEITSQQLNNNFSQLDSDKIGKEWMYFLNPTDFGASAVNSKTGNKAAIQAAIAEVDRQGGGLVVIPPYVEYGYSRNVPSTFPDLKSVLNNVIVMDMSTGDNANGRNGMQLKYFTKTDGIETDGQHDGNTFFWRGDWHPAFLIMNDRDDASATNYRASVIFGTRGVTKWRIGQGTKTRGEGGTPIDAPQEELEHFLISGNDIDGGSGLTTMLVILKTNGWFGFNTGNPLADFHFRGRGDNDPKHTMLIESPGGSAYLELKSSGVSRQLACTTAGDLVVLNKAGNASVATIYDEGTAKFNKGVGGGTCTSSTRPSLTPQQAGTHIFDTTIGKPIWWNGSSWRDAIGNAV